MPLPCTPFEQVAVDLVAPIKPASDRGNRYILVMVDYSTRYPEAVPPKQVDAETVVKAFENCGLEWESHGRSSQIEGQSSQEK